MWRRLAISLTLLAGLAACASTSPGVGEGASTTTAPESARVPEGFERAAATVTTADGEVCELCLWVADTTDLRALGLMFVTDLGHADGMVFVYPSPRGGTFWMKNTVLPLSIAYFGADGRFLDSHDMEPCRSEDCQRYRTAPDMQFAIETTQGDLVDLGIGPGSTLELTGLPCA